MIKSAVISHFKSISDAHLYFRPINVIVGPNGSGKSNILDALYFLHDCASDDIDTAMTKRHGIDSLRQWSRTKPYHLSIEVKLENRKGRGSYKLTVSSNKGDYRIIEETGSWYGSRPLSLLSKDSERRHSSFTRDETGRFEIQSGFEEMKQDRSFRVNEDELLLSSLSSRASFGPIVLFKPIADELISFSKYNVYPNTLREPQLVSKETSLSESGSNLSTILKRINANKRGTTSKDNIISSIQLIMPTVVDFQVRSAAGYYVPVLRVKEINGDVHDFNLSQISDGTLRTLGLLTAFYQPSAPDKIGVEEPEQMVHPGALNVLFDALSAFIESSVREQRQVFVTTHSPTFIDLFNPKDIFWARIVDGNTKCGPIKERQLDIIKRQLFTAGELLIAEGIF